MIARHRHALMTLFAAFALIFTVNAVYWTDGIFRWIAALDATFYLVVFMWAAISERFRP